MNICEREDLIIANLPKEPKPDKPKRITNLDELKAQVKSTYINFANAAKELGVSYQYLTSVLNNQNIYWDVVSALRAHGFTVEI